MTGALVRVISGPGYQFDTPDAMVLDGDDLFVANGGGLGRTGSLTEVNASTGALVRVVPRPAHFDRPTALVPDGDDLFVANEGGLGSTGSLTELNALTGAFIKSVSGPRYQFDGPDAMVLEGDDLFVTDESSGTFSAGSLTEVNTATGALVRVVPLHSSNGPGAMVLDQGDLFVGTNLFVVKGSGSDVEGSLTEVRASTGALVRVVSGARYQWFDTPSAMLADGPELFVASGAFFGRTGSVTEVDASTGALVKVSYGVWYRLLTCRSPWCCAGATCSWRTGATTHSRRLTLYWAPVRGNPGPAYQFDEPSAMVLRGSDLFVANGGNNSLTEIDALDGGARQGGSLAPHTSSTSRAQWYGTGTTCS